MQGIVNRFLTVAGLGATAWALESKGYHTGAGFVVFFLVLILVDGAADFRSWVQ